MNIVGVSAYYHDSAACLVRDGATLRETFSERPDYLAAGQGLAGGDLWFCDYGTELSRGFRALKVWASLQALGTDALGAAISDNCRQAALMGALVSEAPRLTLARPVISNLCVFHVAGASAAEVAARLQLSGEVVFSTTRIDGAECLRAAIVNHRTTTADIHAAVNAVLAAIA
ncbi:hypothetical protein LCGC14_2706230 [marine sediment metagenome]|uniref:Aminotransferase class V domain-containing protein n=1 Tax=marine sediment metagenome TaxID=412755 RepID=A0A0F8ZE77_9ZZZZ